MRFHNGDPVTADDVKFSFERYRGAANKLMKERVAAVEVVDPQRVRFRLKEPWPDFITYYGSPPPARAGSCRGSTSRRSATTASRRRPVGAGPYRFVSFNPGVELVLEAHEQYWRKVPSVKRLVLSSVPDETTRLAMLKRGEADIVYLLQAELAEDVRRTAGLTLRPTPIVSTHWVVFTDQWDPKSPWADRRVRLAANHAVDRQAINQALTLGFSRITGSIIPQSFEFFWAAAGSRLRRRPGQAAPRRGRLPERVRRGRPLVRRRHRHHERGRRQLPAGRRHPRQGQAARAGGLLQGLPRQEAPGLIYGISGAFGNAATRIEAFVAAGGTYVYGSYPDIDGLYREQAAELDRKRREATLHRIQQLMHEKVVHLPIWELGFIHGIGPRVAESASASSPATRSPRRTRT